MLPCILELLTDEWNPLCFRYLVEKHDVAKLVEWAFCGVEQLSHQVFFASKHTVGSQLLMLPHSPQFLLEGKRVLKVSYLLKLIKAHYYFYALFLCNFLWQLQDFPFRVILWIPGKRQRKVVHWISTEGELRRDVGKKGLCHLNPFVPFGRCLADGFRCQHLAKLIVGLT